MRRTAALCLGVVLCLGLASAPARAQDGIFQGMQKGLESVFSTVSTTTTLASGQVLKTNTTNVYPSVNLNIDSLIFPSVRLNAGGVFEVNFLSTTSNGAVTDSTISRNRPFIQLRSTNPIFSPGFGYFRREDRARVTGVSDVKLINDEYAGYLGWNPVGGPTNDFQFLRTHTFDATKAFQDVQRDFGSVVSNYNRGNLAAYFRGSYLDNDDRLRSVETRQVTESGRVSYGGTFINKRLVWDAAYNVNHQDLRTITNRTGGDIDVPLTPFTGLGVLSDTPVIARLSPNAALIDGNLTAGSGIDIGIAVPPADTQARNIGLDFLNPARVNRLLVWVDRQLPIEVSNSFSWEIYSSTDNITWKRETMVSPAPFDPFENRFEVLFPAITSRYVKVVVRPLTAVVPDAARYQNILVTELQAFLRQPAGQAASTISQTTHLINADAKMRLVDDLYYEGFYLYNGPDSLGAHTDTLSNGLSINRTFGRIFSAYGRAAREQGSEARGERTATVTNATFTADPIPTFRSSFLYTGLDEHITGLSNTRRGIFVQNALRPYRGVDMLFGFGWNYTTRESGENSHDRLLNVSGNIVPRQHLALTFSYDDTTSHFSGTFVGNPAAHTRRVYGAVTVDPVPTFHLLLGEEVISVTGQPTRTTTDIGVNWSPFPDGTLQFMFASNAAVRALEFGNDRNTLGSIRWNISRRSFVDVTYQKTRSEFIFETTDSRIFSVSVRFFF